MQVQRPTVEVQFSRHLLPAMSQVLTALRNVFDWYPSDYSPQERKLLRKLDYTLLIFASLSCESEEGRQRLSTS